MKVIHFIRKKKKKKKKVFNPLIRQLPNKNKPAECFWLAMQLWVGVKLYRHTRFWLWSLLPAISISCPKVTYFYLSLSPLSAARRWRSWPIMVHVTDSHVHNFALNNKFFSSPRYDCGKDFNLVFIVWLNLIYILQIIHHFKFIAPLYHP